MANMNKIDELVNCEWADFQKVNNAGGRASCQDDPETFFIMRKSYFGPLSDVVVDCISNDFAVAHEQGRNLVAEKYAWMMQSTASVQFEQIRGTLTEPTVMSKTYAELIIVCELDWMEEFADAFPKLSSHGRPIHTSGDTPSQTSLETYLRGELYTYSETTLHAYYDFIKLAKENGVNIIFQTMEIEVKAYGYSSLSDAESKLN